MTSQEKPCYVRFGNLPRAKLARSTNILAGPSPSGEWERLAGLSVYRGVILEPDLFRIDTSDLTYQGLAALIAFAAGDRPAWFVSGEEVGTGPDGEPLLKVGYSWPVPRTTNIRPTDIGAQPALRLWSRGPRDGSASSSLVVWRLRKGSGYVPSGMASGTQESPAGVAGRRKKKPGDKKKQARKKQRGKN